jgi:hypothetical protein
MCMSFNNERAARNWVTEKLRNIASMPERFPDSLGLRDYMKHERAGLSFEIRMWQQHEGWLMDWDADTLTPKAPKVRTDFGVKAIKRALTPRQLRPIAIEEEVREEAQKDAQLEAARPDQRADVMIGLLRYVWR